MRMEPSQMELVPLEKNPREITSPLALGGSQPSMNQEVGSYQSPHQICWPHEVELLNLQNSEI